MATCPLLTSLGIQVFIYISTFQEEALTRLAWKTQQLPHFYLCCRSSVLYIGLTSVSNRKEEHFKTKPTLKLVNSHNRRINRKDSVSDIFRKIMQSKHPQNVLRTLTFKNRNQ